MIENWIELNFNYRKMAEIGFKMGKLGGKILENGVKWIELKLLSNELNWNCCQMNWIHSNGVKVAVVGLK